MTRLKNPLLSLDAHGSLGEAITFTERRGQKIAEKKPELPYFLTLPVQYQRWLYQDYCYLWGKQTAMTKALYQSSGVRHHLTGFQYFMKYHLTYLPDILGWWKMDDNAGPTIVDSSRYGVTGTVIGASPTTGLIAGGLSFDGVNDLVNLGSPTHLQNLRAASLVVNFRPSAFTAVNQYIYYASHFGVGFGHYLRTALAANNYICTIRLSNGASQNCNRPYTPGNWLSFAWSWDGARISFFENGVRFLGPLPLVGILQATANPFTLGTRPPADWLNGLIDNLIIYNRFLDSEEAARWAERRWP